MKMISPFLFILLVLLSGCHDDHYIIDSSEEEAGVFGYLTTPENTTITSTEGYTYIRGNFNNSPIINFYFNESIPALVYNISESRYYEINWDCQVSSSKSSNTIKIAINLSGDIYPSGGMQNFAKYADEQTHNSGQTVVKINKGDTIQLVTQASRTGTLRFQEFTTSINKFYNTDKGVS